MTNFQDVFRYTAVIADLRDMREKLWFNIQVYEWAVTNRDAGTNQGFAVLDYAQASCAMHAWACKLLQERGQSASKDRLAAIPWSGALRAVANNSKHASASEKDWPGGSNAVNFPADPDAKAAPEQDLAKPDTNFASFLDSINNGQVWGEDHFSDPDHPEGVPALAVLHANYSGWPEVLEQLGLLE